MNQHEPIILKCMGCCHVFKEVVGDKREVCRRHPFPRMQWFGDIVCEDASHHGKGKDNQDDIYQGRYDNRKSFK